MPVADLYNVPSDEPGFLRFTFHNMDQHRLIVAAIAAQKNIALPLYALDPVAPSNISEFLAIHQQAHNDFTGVLGIAGVDLTSVDFKDPEQLASWSRLHGEEHRQAANILGFG